MNKATKRAYTAGLIDGEGTITIDKRIRPNTVWYQVHIRVAMTKNEPLVKMQQWWGGYVNTVPYNHANNNNNGKWSTYYAWQLWTREAVGFLAAIEPYLILKKPHARVAMEFQSRIHKVGGEKIPAEELSIREALYQKMKRLNSRGLHLQRLSEEDGADNTVCDSPILKDSKLEVALC